MHKGNDGSFLMDPKTGAIKISPIASLDYEQIKIHQLKVIVTDGVHYQSIEVTVNQNFFLLFCGNM